MIHIQAPDEVVFPDEVMDEDSLPDEEVLVDVDYEWGEELGVQRACLTELGDAKLYANGM